MSSFTIVNLKEIDDDTGGRAPGIEGRFARKYLDSEHLGVSHWRYGPGVRASMAHHHKSQEEAYIVVAGSGRIRLGDEVRDVREWDVIRVSPETIRAFEAGDDA